MNNFKKIKYLFLLILYVHIGCAKDDIQPNRFRKISMHQIPDKELVSQIMLFLRRLESNNINQNTKKKVLYIATDIKLSCPSKIKLGRHKAIVRVDSFHGSKYQASVISGIKNSELSLFNRYVIKFTGKVLLDNKLLPEHFSTINNRTLFLPLSGYTISPKSITRRGKHIFRLKGKILVTDSKTKDIIFSRIIDKSVHFITE